MKIYIQPRVRIIDLCEEDGVLTGSQQGSEESLMVNSGYGKQALSHQKDGGIWKTEGWLSD